MVPSDLRNLCVAAYPPAVTAPAALDSAAVRFATVTATATVTIGNVPRWMKAAMLRLLVERLTNVRPQSVQEDFRGSAGKRVLFRMRVRPEECAAVLAMSGRALCCPEFVWVLGAFADGTVVPAQREVALELKVAGFVQHGPMRFEVQKPRAPLANNGATSAAPCGAQDFP